MSQYKERYRPQFHFSPAEMWMNDPNGMVYYEGEYHLFYQHHPNGTTWGPMHWGHAVSKDLIHWQHHPIALWPDHNGQIFSGGAVVDWNDTSGLFGGKPGLVAIFTHADVDPVSSKPRQRQSLAYSEDRGRTWVMYAGNPVLSHERYSDFRDPKVFWHAPEQHWIMVLAAGDRVLIYASANLKEWVFASEFGAQDGSHDGVWECPDLIELPVEGQADVTKWVLIVSIGDSPEFAEGSRTQYFVGHFDGTAFINENSHNTVLWLDHGRDNYAGVTWSNADQEDQGKLFIGWMSNWKYANLTPTVSWRSAMTLPRVLYLTLGSGGIRLAQRVVSPITKLRAAASCWQSEVLRPGHNLLANEKGDLLEIDCVIDLLDAEEIGFKLRKSEHEETIVGYNAETQTLFLDRRRSGEVGFHEAFACRHDIKLELTDRRLKLQLYVDSSSIEVFANDGEIVMTDLIFPDPSSVGLELYVSKGTAKAVSLDLYAIQSIFSEVSV